MAYNRGDLRIIAAVATVPVVAGCWVGARTMLQFRAYYPGSLTFVGNANGLFGARYVRFFMWKPPDYTDALPDLTLHVDGQPYAVTDLTEEAFTSLGGTVPEGGIYDTLGNVIKYRFENGRLTWISLTPPFRPTSKERTATTGGNIRPGVFHISLENGPPFPLPVTLSELRAWAGTPVSTGISFAN